jgi:hypothetical protein
MIITTINHDDTRYVRLRRPDSRRLFLTNLLIFFLTAIHFLLPERVL